MIYVLALLASLNSFAISDFKCEARYDELGIPHQKVKNIDHFYYCFGYHHGADRAWEMDYFRRVGQGRNAEVYGFSWLKSDLMMRLLDLPAFAEKLYQGMPEKQKGLLIKYSEGANQGFATGGKVHEFKDLGYSPEPWTPADSILVMLLQSFDQTRKTFLKDYDEEKWGEIWKEKAEGLFDEDGIPWLNTILKDGEYPKAGVEQKKVSFIKKTKIMPWSDFPTVFGEESGSNNWVIAAPKSKGGFAMLANDPHLDLKTPLFWYWLHLESPDMKIMGASVPGAPFVVSGTNGKVAWGLTNAYINTADAVFMKDEPKDYYVSIRPTVKVKFGFMQLPFFFKSFEKTKEGFPVLPLETEREGKLILKWSGFYLKSEDLISMFELVYAKNVTDMNETLKQVGLPAWNFVFADTKGDIGYRVVGNPFKHQEKPPFAIATVTPKDLENPEFLSPLERPHVLKPKRNYVYTANNRHWPADAQYHGGRGYSFSFRGFRIDELLKDGKFNWEDLTKVQCDRQAVDARFFVPLISKHIKVPEFEGWEYGTDNGIVGPGLYRRLMDLMMEEWKVNEIALYRLLSERTDERTKEMESILKKTRADVKDRKWGDLHRLTFAHLSKNGDWAYSPEVSGLGDNHSVDPGTSKWESEGKFYEHYSGASMRLVIELKDKPVVHLSLPGHNRDYQVQHKFSPWDSWVNCEYKEVAMEL